MSRVALINMAWGFFLVFLAACGGVFLAVTTTEAFLRGPVTPTWESMLQSSSHGHTNLFGVLHVLLGLTIPYARATSRDDILKTIGLGLGGFAMGPMLIVRSYLGPTLSTELNGVVIGLCLSCALLAIGYHAFGLWRKVAFRG